MGAFRILVVDDAYPMARALSYLLSRNGYECDVARDGVEALEKIHAFRPDLVFLDLQMPRMDGIETCRRLRAGETARRTHVIVLTAMGQDEDTARALGAGADECMAKPFSPRHVLERVRGALKPVETS
jgi:DNA-binding response OmpR family regulator